MSDYELIYKLEILLSIFEDRKNDKEFLDILKDQSELTKDIFERNLY